MLLSGGVAVDLGVIFASIVLLVLLANRLGIAYPIVLVLGGIALGYIPQLPALSMPPEIVLLVFLPPLLYWESVTAPTSEFFSRSGLMWITQLALGLVIVTTLAVTAVAHALIPPLTWATAFVLGAIVSSTDEVAFGPIVERIKMPRHVLATIEGESLVNDATSLVLYGMAVAAVAAGTFSLPQAALHLIVSVIGAIAIGIAVGLVAALAWRLTKDDSLQGIISLMAPFLSYLPASRLGLSAVVAVIATGFTVNLYTPIVLTPRSRERATGFWVTIVFMLNAFIFVLAGLQFHRILASLRHTPVRDLAFYAFVVCATVVAVRLIWVFALGLLPSTQEPVPEKPKVYWGHVAVIAWSGMRGGVSLAAALAIPLETAAGPFRHRDLIIFLTFCVLLATLVLQGGTLPFLMRALGIRDDGADAEEERFALAQTAKAALKRLDELEKRKSISPGVVKMLRTRFKARWNEFAYDGGGEPRSQGADQYRHHLREILEVQRAELIKLRNQGRVDNTVMRRIQRLLDLEVEEIDLLENTHHTDIEDD